MDNYFRDYLFICLDYIPCDAKKQHSLYLEMVEDNIFCTVNLFDKIKCKFVVSFSSKEYVVGDSVLFKRVSKIEGGENLYLENMI